MPQTVKGVIARSKGADVELVDIVVPDPGPGEAVVQIQSCGVCHTDLHYREGGINDDFPFLLGHEAAGVVEAVGEGVTDVAPGDFVILNWRAVCGQCRACAKGKPWYCFNTHNATQKMTLDRRHRAQPGARHRRVHREDPRRRRPVHQGRRRGRRGRGRPARLRRDGRLRCRRQHRRGRPRRLDRRHRLRRRRQRRHRRCHRWPARRRSSPSTSTTGSSRAPRSFGATHTVNGKDEDVVERDPRAHGRLRRRRGGRGGRPARDLRAGVLRPRPGRHGRARRRPDARTSRSPCR